jgi:chemotaxis regulatin CheY-phosphate phosphatase CheZ
LKRCLPPAPPVPPAPARSDATGDSTTCRPCSTASPRRSSERGTGHRCRRGRRSAGRGRVQRLGHLARQLHDSLRGLGVDKLLVDTADQIPDARQRLAYIAQMTEQAASRVLNAADIAKPLQDELMARSHCDGTPLGPRCSPTGCRWTSSRRWRRTRALTLRRRRPKLKLTNDQLMEIIMAQDFQDLTGQVIKKVVEMVQGMETSCWACCSRPCRRAQGGSARGPAQRSGGQRRRQARWSPIRRRWMICWRAWGSDFKPSDGGMTQGIRRNACRSFRSRPSEQGEMQ